MNHVLIIGVIAAVIFGGALLIQKKAVTIPFDSFIPEKEESKKTEDVQKDTQQETEDADVPTQETRGAVLDLSGQGLVKTPEYVFSQTGIVTLDLSHNKLDGALQAEIRHLTKLNILRLNDNNFTGVPAEIGQLRELEILDLSNNPITGLPHELGNLKKLKVLNLRGTNYAVQDLEIIRRTLPSGVDIQLD